MIRGLFFRRMQRVHGLFRKSGEGLLQMQDMVFGVSDGMGGGNAGDMASALILERLAELIPETFRAAASGFFPDSISYLEQALKEVHDHINEAALFCESCTGMAATLALVWFSPENLYLANVGELADLSEAGRSN